MRSRGLVVAIAVVLAVLAAVGVIVYTQSVKEGAVSENTTPVIASSQDIPAGTELDPLIASGVFKTINVPNADVVPGAVTDTTQLQGQTTSAQIFQNEQITTARLASSGESNPVGVSPGNVGLGLQVEGSAAVNGNVQVGSFVALYATYEQGTIVTRQNLRFYLSAAQINKLVQAAGGTAANPQAIVMPTDFTVTLVPSVKILAAQNPPVDATTGRSTAGQSVFVLDLSPEDASNVVFAIGHSTLYMGLLPPDNKDGYDEPGVIGAPYARVTGVGK